MTRALVIDDDPLIAAYLQELEPEWQVIAMSDGRSALQLLQRLRAVRSLPDIVILDIAMPHIDGYDTCVLIRTGFPSIPILPFTSIELQSQPRLIDYMDELGCSPVVPKGVPPSIMRESLERALEQPPRPIMPGPGLLGQLQAKAHTLVRSRERHDLTIIGFAVSVAHIAVLQSLLQSLAEIILAPSQQAATALLTTSARSCVAGVAGDAQTLLALAEEAQRPALLIATTRAEARSLSALCDAHPNLIIGLVCAHDGSASERLSAALTAIAFETNYRDPSAASSPAQDERNRLDTAFNELPPRLREVVLLHALGSSSQAIMREMAISAGTLNQYWKRIYARLDANRHEVEERARQALA